VQQVSTTEPVSRSTSCVDVSVEGKQNFQTVFNFWIFLQIKNCKSHAQIVMELCVLCTNKQIAFDNTSSHFFCKTVPAKASHLAKKHLFPLVPGRIQYHEIVQRFEMPCLISDLHDIREL